MISPIDVLEQYANIVSQAKGYGDEAKRPPPLGLPRGTYYQKPSKVDQDIDHEERRAAPSALGIKLAWLFRDNIAGLTTFSAQNKLRAIKAVVDVFHKDVDSNMDNQVTRAVHHRRNMIRLATQDMPQADVRATVQDLLLLAGPTLVHESAAVTIEPTLQNPEDRQLAIIRHCPVKKPY